MVRDPDCRLVTITGIGGVGKTRLATELVVKLAREFDDGAYIVQAENASNLDRLYHAIADAAGLRLSSKAPVEQRVADWMSQTSALLVLDNLEQLSHYGAEIAPLFGLSPGSQFVATSRAPLGVAEEWVFPLDGLSSSLKIEDGASLQLFERIARRVNPGFTVETGSDVETHVSRICQIVGGVPLAIEMVAPWTRILPVAELVKELESDSQLLISERRDRPLRHQSMKAVFDGSWRMLSDTQQEIFSALAMLRGPFDRQAAKAIANASLIDIGELVNASMIHAEPDGTFICHPVLKRFALEVQPGTKNEDRVSRRIATHYSSLAENIFPGPNRRLTELELAKIADRQLENFKLAMEIASDQLDIDQLRPLTAFFIYYLEFKARYLDGIALMESVAALLENSPDKAAIMLRAAAISDIGWWHLRLGNTDLALNNAHESIALCQSINANMAEFPSTDPTLLKAYVASVNGDMPNARRIAESRLDEGPDHLNSFAKMLAEYLLATVELHDGNTDSARSHTNAALDSARSAGETWFEAYCVSLMGDLVAIEGDFPRADDFYKESYSIRLSYDDPVGMGEALIKRGEVSLITGDIDAARRSFTDAQSALETTGDRGNLGLASSGLALTLIDDGRFDEAFSLLSRCLTTASDLHFQNLLLRSMVGLGRLHIATGDQDLGQTALRAIGSYGHSDFILRALTGSAESNQLMASGSRNNQETASVGEEWLNELETRLLDRSLLALQTPADATGSSGEFSEREIQILTLMADGKTNPEIAEHLIISPGTVKWYSSQIYSRLAVRNRAQAISEARKRSII